MSTPLIIVTPRNDLHIEHADGIHNLLYVATDQHTNEGVVKTFKDETVTDWINTHNQANTVFYMPAGYVNNKSGYYTNSIDKILIPVLNQIADKFQPASVTQIACDCSNGGRNAAIGKGFRFEESDCGGAKYIRKTISNFGIAPDAVRYFISNGHAQRAYSFAVGIKDSLNEEIKKDVSLAALKQAERELDIEAQFRVLISDSLASPESISISQERIQKVRDDMLMVSLGDYRLRKGNPGERADHIELLRKENKANKIESISALVKKAFVHHMKRSVQCNEAFEARQAYVLAVMYNLGTAFLQRADEQYMRIKPGTSLARENHEVSVTSLQDLEGVMR